MTKIIQLGIDPGKITALGVADMARRHDRLLEIHTFGNPRTKLKDGYREAKNGFWPCLRHILGQFTPSEVYRVNIEVTNTTAPFTPALNFPENKNKRSFTRAETDSIARMSHKMGGNVGGVKMQGILLAEELEYRGFKVKIVAPIGKAKGKGVNRDQQLAFFKRATGWTKKSNEHTRDAGLLAVLE